jgi:hypothetical protein
MLLPFAAEALDLTPNPSFRDLEGFKIPIVLFNDLGRKISFQPPSKWNVSGGGTTLNLYPVDLPDAVMQLRVRHRTVLKPGEVEDLDQWCRTQLPQDAADLTLDSEAVSPFTLDSRPSRQFTYSYAAQGRRFTTAVAIVDWNERERLVVVITSRDTDFKAVFGQGIRSLSSWTTQG